MTRKNRNSAFTRQRTSLCVQRHEIDVQLYLRSVLAHLPGLSPEELHNYLPDVWKRDLMAEQQATLIAHHAKLIRADSH